MFSLIGIGLACYSAIAVVTGRVWVRSGIGAQTISRTEKPVRFWIDIAIYAGLSAALVWLF